MSNSSTSLFIRWNDSLDDKPLSCKVLNFFCLLLEWWVAIALVHYDVMTVNGQRKGRYAVIKTPHSLSPSMRCVMLLYVPISVKTEHHAQKMTTFARRQRNERHYVGKNLQSKRVWKVWPQSPEYQLSLSRNKSVPNRMRITIELGNALPNNESRLFRGEVVSYI